MMRFTDRFFAFPIKIYDGFSLKKALEEESEDGVEGPIAADWISGMCKIPGKEIKHLSWYDGLSREKSIEEAVKEGFDQTTVISLNYGEFICLWPRKKFEEKLNEFAERYENSKKSLDKNIEGLSL